MDYSHLPNDDIDYETNGECDRQFVPPCKLGNLTANESYIKAGAGHIDSFNTMADAYLPAIAENMEPFYVDPLCGNHGNPNYSPEEFLKIECANVALDMPIRLDQTDADGHYEKMFPVFSRLTHTTYGAKLEVSVKSTHYVRAGEDDEEDIVFIGKHRYKAARVTESAANCGSIPIMLRTNRCHTGGMGPNELCAIAKEDPREMGGYFVLNGNERVVRFVIQQRTNFPIAFAKESLEMKDVFYTQYAVQMRGTRSDGTSTNNILHWTTDNSPVFRLLYNRREHFVDFWRLFRALIPDKRPEAIRDLWNRLSSLMKNDSSLLLKFNLMWRDNVEEPLKIPMTADSDFDDKQMADFGRHFFHKVKMYPTRVLPGSPMEEFGRTVIRSSIMVHSKDFGVKFDSLVLMIHKLLCVVEGVIPPENIDSFAYQEICLPGQIYGNVIQDSVWTMVNNVANRLHNECRSAKTALASGGVGATVDKVFSPIRNEQRFLDHLNTSRYIPGNRIRNFVSTGNIDTRQLDLLQVKGWTVVADRINNSRFLSHFRAVHRGQAFTEMRTTEVRKLLGETWGFLCPVHTPDGSPCGLLLHLAQDSVVVASPPTQKAREGVKKALERRNKVTASGGKIFPRRDGASWGEEQYFVVVDGQPVGRIDESEYEDFLGELEEEKRSGKKGYLHYQVEIVAFRKEDGTYPGIFIFSMPSRLVRPVIRVDTGKEEWIGPLQQPWMNIAVLTREVKQGIETSATQEASKEHLRAQSREEVIDEVRKRVAVRNLLKTKGINAREREERDYLGQSPLIYTHVETRATGFISITSSLTPFSNHNQSPRNMYQCQMLKQTMGTFSHSYDYRHDNKSYRLTTPQYPLVRTTDYRKYGIDDYPSGTNAIVAVAAYTGMDMEDAMILNKGSEERGCFAAIVYKQKIIDACPNDKESSMIQRQWVFSGITSSGELADPGINVDGFPTLGTYFTKGTPLYRVRNMRTNECKLKKYEDDEPAYLEKVTLIDGVNENYLENQGKVCFRASVKMRVERPPTVGDKFASRAGQKGIMSMYMPAEDMPFSHQGINPDLLFNPHGFPSRMTVGMLVDSMAGKVSALGGKYNDCTSFRDFPRHRVEGNKWIDGNGFSGYSNRGGRNLSPKEDEEYYRDNSIDHFGKQLLHRGFNYYGSEALMSGIYGNEMEYQIFIGIIYYQRLRHMVSDKWQCRSIGKVDALTRQPVKGRKRGGGVRFGEMERDSIIAHGTSALLQDRLLHCSDAHYCHVCPTCGSILSAQNIKDTEKAICRLCQKSCSLVVMPYVFRYIIHELAAMGITIRVSLGVHDIPIGKT